MPNLYFREDSNNPLPSLDFDGDFSDLNVKFTTQDAPKDWERLLIDAYEDALGESPNGWFRIVSRNNDNNATSRTIRPTFDTNKAKKLSKVDRLRHIRVVVEALDNAGNVVASCESPNIKLPEEYLFDVTRRIDCEPKRWKILLNLDRQAGTKPSSTPMQISVVGQAELETSFKLDLDYENSALDHWCNRLKLLSLKPQFERLKGVFGEAQFIEDVAFAQSGNYSIRRWMCLIDNFTFSFADDEKGELQKVYLGGERVVIPAKLTCKGAESVAFEIEVLPYDDMSVDMIACDWGTSISTAAFYSPTFNRSFISAGLPKEQLSELRIRLENWFKKVGSNLDSESPDAWNAFILDVAQTMGNTTQSNCLEALEEIKISLRGSDAGLYKCWKAVESCLLNVDEEHQEKYRLSLYGIYRDVFSCFPFEKHGIRVANLESEQQISSEFCFDTDKDAFWSEGRMGRCVAEARRRDESEGKPTEKYFRNPKSKIYQIASSNVCDETYSPSQVCQGVLDRLTSLSENELIAEKNYDLGGKKSIPSLVLTYPVTLTAKSRKRLVDTARSLGFPGVAVIAQYDESVAPAVFYLDKSFGNFDEFGLEEFKVKCSYGSDGVWRHNMLIADLGAYTLDISVVQVEMTEQVSGNFGGRAYKVKPTLLGAIGLEQSAGNVVTLYVYHFLKILLARFFTKLDSTKNDSRSPDQFNEVGLTYSDFFKGDNEWYANDDVRKAEARIKTYFRDPTGKSLRENDYIDRIKRFNWLWDFAEAVKIAYSKREGSKSNTQHSDLDLYEGVPELGLTGLKEQLENHESEFSKAFLNGQTENANFSKLDDGDKQLLVFSSDKFENFLKSYAEEKIVKQAVGATKKALETRRNALSRTVDPLIAQTACQGVHSVVLSGRAMRTPQIKEAFEKEIYNSCREFLNRNRKDSTPFARLSTNIVFEDRYAKTATSLGAVRAAQIERETFRSVEDVVQVGVGRCYRGLDVNNLKHSLPSSFVIGVRTLFELQDEFAVFDFRERERIRNKDFSATQNSVVIERCVGSAVTNNEYASFDFEKFFKALQEFDYRNIRVRYEINSELLIFALIKKYQDALKYDLRDTPQEYRFTPTDSEVVKDLFDEANGEIKLKYDVLVQVCTNRDAPLFKVGTALEKECVVVSPQRDETNNDASENGDDGVEEVKFVMSSKCLEIPNVPNRYLTFSYKDGDDVKPLGTIKLTNPAIKSVDRLQWEDKLRVALTSQGEFVLFVGDEPDYWETRDANEWLKASGRILRIDITKANRVKEGHLDPFNGRQ